MGGMESISVVRDAFGRVHELVPAVLNGLSRDDLRWRPDPSANPIGWLVWHLLRVEDDHLAPLAGFDQVWFQGWQERFDLPYAADAGGFGQSPEEVGQFDVPGADLLLGYAKAVAVQTEQVLDALARDDLDRVVDTRWNPPVTLGVRLVSVVLDTAQHVGQAAYVKGLRERLVGHDSGWQGYPE